VKGGCHGLISGICIQDLGKSTEQYLCPGHDSIVQVRSVTGFGYNLFGGILTLYNMGVQTAAHQVVLCGLQPHL